MSLLGLLTRRRLLGLVGLLALTLLPGTTGPARAGTGNHGDGQFVTNSDIDGKVVYVTSVLVDGEEGMYRRTLTVRLRDGKLATAWDRGLYLLGQPVSGSFQFEIEVVEVVGVSFIKETFDP